MKNNLISIYCLLFLMITCACGNASKEAGQEANPSTVPVSSNVSELEKEENAENVGNIPVYDFKSFEPLLHINNDTTYIVNFWATWCKPCVAELPHFEHLNEVYSGDKVKVLLVSLDFSSQIEKKLIPFLKKRQLKSDVVVLDDPDANSWIDKVDPNWSGAIPATVIFKGDKRGFFERSFEKYEDLVAVMNEVIK